MPEVALAASYSLAALATCALAVAAAWSTFFAAWSALEEYSVVLRRCSNFLLTSRSCTELE